MESISKATFVLIPGVFHTAAHAKTLVESLHAKGHPVEIIAHPTIDPLACTAPPNADAANLRSVLERLINDEQKDVILFCHSYGGVPGSQSVNGLERKARAKAGQKGGILKVIYLSAILPREGESVIQTLAGAEIAPAVWMEIDVASEVLFHDLPDDQAEHWALKLEPMSPHFAITPATNVCWETDVPKVYIFCKKDRALSLQEQQRILERVQGDRKDDWDTYEMDCGHSPFLSHVEELTGILAS
ncbi:Alpha/beta hydrolase fold-1 [Mycena capillaripes]|nr:Alpha/beta hydrolase fold-1 [Mycena capillaripes]